MAEAFYFFISVGIATLIWRSFFPSYLNEKGKNLATKEDVAEITTKVEDVKEFYSKRLKDLEHQNALVLEQLRVQHQLRLAAVDRRLAAHQEAFILWRRLLGAVDSEQVHSLVLECQDWWEKNCLYLSAEARDSFNLAYLAAGSHRDLIQSSANVQHVTSNMDLVMKAGTDIVAGVELPSLGKREGESSA